MEKVFDRLFVEFLIPAFLMLACGLLFLQLLSGGNFDLGRADSRNVFFGNNAFVFGGIVFAYVVNTSLSALLNLISRILLWGKTREYLMYRKLDVFKLPALQSRLQLRLRACQRAGRHHCTRHNFHRALRVSIMQFGIREEDGGAVKITWIGYVLHRKSLWIAIDRVLKNAKNTLYDLLKDKAHVGVTSFL